jgi:hypothetical protein
MYILCNITSFTIMVGKNSNLYNDERSTKQFFLLLLLTLVRLVIC